VIYALLLDARALQAHDAHRIETEVLISIACGAVCHFEQRVVGALKEGVQTLGQQASSVVLYTLQYCRQWSVSGGRVIQWLAQFVISAATRKMLLAIRSLDFI